MKSDTQPLCLVNAIALPQADHPNRCRVCDKSGEDALLEHVHAAMQF